MTFTQAVHSVLGKYATFSGRATRSEYWWFYLFTILVSIATAGMDAALNFAFDNAIGVVGTIASLVLLLPSVAVTARRLHDTGRTGWWMLLPVVPLLATVVLGFATVFTILFSAFGGDPIDSDVSAALVAALVVLLIACGLITLGACVTLLVFFCLDSQPGPNKYGASPKQPIEPTGPYGYPSPGDWRPPPGYAQPHAFPGQHPPSPTPGADSPQS